MVFFTIGIYIPSYKYDYNVSITLRTNVIPIYQSSIGKTDIMFSILK